jgi:hypothetical protein
LQQSVQRDAFGLTPGFPSNFRRAGGDSCEVGFVGSISRDEIGCFTTAYIVFGLTPGFSSNFRRAGGDSCEVDLVGPLSRDEIGSDKALVAPPRKKRRAPPPPQAQAQSVQNTVQVEISVEKTNLEKMAKSKVETNEIKQRTEKVPSSFYEEELRGLCRFR